MHNLQGLEYVSIASIQSMPISCDEIMKKISVAGLRYGTQSDYYNLEVSFAGGDLFSIFGMKQIHNF